MAQCILPHRALFRGQFRDHTLMRGHWLLSVLLMATISIMCSIRFGNILTPQMLIVGLSLLTEDDNIPVL